MYSKFSIAPFLLQ